MSFSISTPYSYLLSRIEQSSGSSYILPSSLQSIANLSTTGNEMLYTTATDTYTTLPNVTEFGRGFLIQSSQNSAQSYIGTRVGTDVQPFSSVLSGITSTSLETNDILYSTSATTFNTITSTTFGRGLLSESNATSLVNTLGTVTTEGSSSSDNAIVRWSGTGLNIIQNSSGATITDAGILNTSGIEVDTINPATTNLTISSEEIPNANWAFIKTVNQNLGTTGTPQFSSIQAGSVNLSGAITQNTQAATKLYVDTVALSGITPLDVVVVASTGPLNATYSSGTETFTATSNGAIVVDGISLSLTDSLLVKNEGGGAGTSNGVYTVTVVGDGSNPYEITRRSDFNTAAQPINANSLVFVQSGTVNQGSQWILQNTVTTIDTDPVQFTQFGGGGGLSEGNGIDITGSTISVDASSTFLNAPLGFNQGGTNTSSFTSGNRLVRTNVGNTALEASILEVSDVVTLSDVQVMTNKTITDTTNIIRATQLGTTSSDVNVSSAAAPATGYVLTATSPTTATWQVPTVGTNRTVTVATSGGDYSSIATAIANIGTDSRLTPAASLSNPIVIQVAPGEYTEPQIIVPPYVTIRGMGRPLNCRVVASDPTNDLFILSYAGAVQNIDARGVTTAGKAAFRVSYAVGAGPTTTFTNCIARGCQIGFYCNGTTAQFSSVALIYNCNALSTASGPVTSAYLADAGAVMVGFNCTVSGFYAGSINLQKGYDVTGSGSIMTLYSSDVSFVGTAFNCDAGAEFRITGGNAGNFENYGLDLGPGGSVARILSVFFQDNTALFANQIPVRTQTGSQLLEIVGSILRGELIELDSGTFVTGNYTSPGEIPGEEVKTQLVGELTVGLPGRGFEASIGEGDSSIINMVVKRYNANTTLFDTITDDVSFNDGLSVAVFPSNTVGDILYIGNTSRSFLGVKVLTSVAAIPTGCNTATTEPPVYSVVWEYWNGSAWQEFRHFASLSGSPYTPKRRSSFLSGNYQYRFENINQNNPRRAIPSTATFVSSAGPGGPNKWVTNGGVPNAWTQTTIDTVNAYWVRVRLVTILTVVPTIIQIKCHTNRTEINADGTVEFFGAARQRTPLGINITNFLPSVSNAPSSSNVYISNTINFAGIQNQYSNNATDTSVAAIYIPSEICTSCPSMLIWRWFPSSGQSANVLWKISWAYVKPFDVDSGTVSTLYTAAGGVPITQATEQSITFTTPTPGISGKVVDSFCLIDVSDTLSTYTNVEAAIGDTLYIAITRIGGGAADTYSGNVNVDTISYIYVKSFIGASTSNS